MEKLYGFLTELEVEFLPSGKVRLLKPLIYRSPRHLQWLVPAGFECDLASVPKVVPGFIRMLFGDKIETAKAAVLHDWFYHRGALRRSDADYYFWEALRSENEGRVGSFLLWSGVRLGGWLSWHHDD